MVTYVSQCLPEECLREHNYHPVLSASKGPTLPKPKSEKTMVLVNSYSADLDENVWLNMWKTKVFLFASFCHQAGPQNH